MEVLPPVKCLIFDLGNVLLSANYEPTFQSWATLTKKDWQELKSNFHTDYIFHDFERGDISPEEFRKELQTKLNITLTPEDFDTGWNSVYGDVFEGAIPWLTELKKQYRIVALINTNSIHYPIILQKYSALLTVFEKVFTSIEMKARIPERQAFYTPVYFFNVPESEIVYIDDDEENIKKAKEIGLKTYLAKDFTSMQTELNEALTPVKTE